MTEERLQAIEDWARAWSRVDTQAGRVVLELVAEVRRQQAVPVSIGYPPEVSEQEIESIRSQLLRKYGMRRARAIAALPTGETQPEQPFRGVLDGMTAADVYGVHV